MGLFNFIGEKILDVAIAGVDALDKGFDKFSGTVDNIIDKAGDVRWKAEDMFIEAECGIKNIVSDIKYGQYEYIKEDIQILFDGISNTKIELDKEVQETLKHINDLINQANYIKNKFNVTKDVALRLATEFRSKNK